MSGIFDDVLDIARVVGGTMDPTGLGLYAEEFVKDMQESSRPNYHRSSTYRPSETKTKKSDSLNKFDNSLKEYFSFDVVQDDMGKLVSNFQGKIWYILDDLITGKSADFNNHRVCAIISVYAYKLSEHFTRIGKHKYARATTYLQVTNAVMSTTISEWYQSYTYFAKNTGMNLNNADTLTYLFKHIPESKEKHDHIVAALKVLRDSLDELLIEAISPR